MTANVCPSTDELAAYVLGRLSDGRSEEIDMHLDLCRACQGELETCGNAGDTFFSRLRTPDSSSEFIDEPACAEMLARVAAIGCDPSFLTQQLLAEPAESSSELGNVGPYRLLAKLGQGGMGTVYKALHTKLKRVVALKMLPVERLKDNESVSRFEREMEAIGKLVHPHIVMAHDAGEQDSHDVDHRTDIYALGATLYKLLTGTAIYSGPGYKTVMQKWKALATEEAIPISQRRPEVPSELATIVHRMIAKSKEHRYDSAGDVAAALAGFCQGADLVGMHLGWEASRRATPEQQAASKSAATWSQVSSADTDTTREYQKEPAAGSGLAGLGGTRRYIPPWALLLVFLLVGGGGVSLWQIIIRIRDKDGRETVFHVSEESRIVIEPDSANREPTSDSVQRAPVTLAPSIRNRALQLDGHGTFVSVPAIRYRGQTPLTVEGWFFMQQKTDNSPLISNAFGPGFVLKVNKTGGWQFMMSNRRGWVHNDAANEADLNRWTHAAGVWDWKELRTYVNGQLVEKVDLPRQDHFPSPGGVAIGAYPAGDNNNFIGLIDEIRMSKDARYASEFVPERHFSATDSTLVLYRFNEASGAIAFDESGNEQHGVIHRPRWVDVDAGEDTEDTTQP